MIYRKMCICDVEPVYLKRLSAYLNRYPGFLWKVQTYTDLKKCLNETPEVLLVSGNALEDYISETHGEEGLDISEGNILQTAGCQVIFLEDDRENPGTWPAIKKYQSAKKLYEDLIEILGEDVSGKTEVIGVFGPASGPEAERFAVEIGKTRLTSGEVLLVSLTEFSTFLSEDTEKKGIGEWFYYQMQRQEGRARISDWVYSEDNMDYLRGFRTIYDRMEVSLDAWRGFYAEALRKSRYGTAILVFERLPEYMELFMWCDCIYVKWGQDGYGDFRKQEFTKMTAYMGMDELMDKMIEE